MHSCCCGGCRRSQIPQVNSPRISSTRYSRYFDSALRELGVGDISVPKRMKTLASAFYGRTKAYEAAMGSEDYLPQRLQLNLFNRSVTVPGAPRVVAAYMRNAASLLERCAFDDFVAAGSNFPPCRRRRTHDRSQ